MERRRSALAKAAMVSSATVALVFALAACGVSVTRGGENSATHPASGIFVPLTVGGGDVSGHPSPTTPYTPPPSTPPPALPAGEAATVSRIEAAVIGGCWQDADAGNVYGAYDQRFWWQGGCGDTAGQVTVELYPSVAAANSQVRHPSLVPLQARFSDGAVLVDVYSNAPLAVVSELGAIGGLHLVLGSASVAAGS
ncbi:MAG TPA: hypothetical protein VED59_06880 [Acidimicrobiales bacterium]|nr:hypothetical protein [Acidimicrobiales bacterium]